MTPHRTVRAVAALATVGLALAGCGSGTAERTAGAASPGDDQPATTATECPPEDGAAERVTSFDDPPPMCIDKAKTYTAVLATDAGDVTVELYAKRAPKTVNNFVVLARYKFYDGLVFHRVIPGFMAQGGDPEGTGAGGPGYEFEDELPQAGDYELGSLAMANAGPDTNGSQFFIITGQAGVQLPPSYSLFGKVTKGMDVMKEIESGGTDAGKPSTIHTIESGGTDAGKPSTIHTIESVTISEK